MQSAQVLEVIKANEKPTNVGYFGFGYFYYSHSKVERVSPRKRIS
jgi:hypothetical protein